MALSLSAREEGDLGARIDAHPSICQQVDEFRQRPTEVEADLGCRERRLHNHGMAAWDRPTMCKE